MTSPLPILRIEPTPLSGMKRSTASRWAPCARRSNRSTSPPLRGCHSRSRTVSTLSNRPGRPVRAYDRHVPSAIDAVPIDPAAFADLDDGFRGELVHPAAADYDERRKVWNGSIDRRPALIARCAGVADVIA